MKLINCADVLQTENEAKGPEPTVKTDPRRENSHFMDHKLHKLHKQHDTGLIYVLKHISSFEVCAWHESNMSQTAV